MDDIINSNGDLEAQEYDSHQETQLPQHIPKLDDYEDELGENDDGFVYNTEDFINSPTFSPESTFTEDPIELDYSYGYACTTPNLCVVEPETLLWHTGNIIHILNVKDKRLRFRRSALGQGISCIAKSHSGDEFAVGENGGYMGGLSSPMIIVYEWPNFTVKAVLKGGATRYYKCLDFSSDGLKLVSQAGPPDNTLTIWDMVKKKSILSFQNPDDSVSKAVFSPYDPDTFITCGRGHIKFWKLVDTFTGIKITSKPGYFGETEINNVAALCFLPNGRIISNLCVGNLGIWRPNALLELDFSMKNDEPCHSGLITFIQIYSNDNHVYTSGLDGSIRVWNYSYITSFYNDDQEESIHIDIEPSYERVIKTDKNQIGFPIQMLPKDEILYPYHFYAQDMKGGIWLLDLELKKNPDPWSLLYTSHSGPINAISPSPVDYYLASLGDGGKMNIYNHVDKNLVLSKQFDTTGTSLLWLPLVVCPSGRCLVIGFNTGVLRVIMVSLKDSRGYPSKQMSILQCLKPHSKSITVIFIHENGPLLLTGSADKSVFYYGFNRIDGIITLIPYGMVALPGVVSHITWNRFKLHQRVILATCDNGEVIEFEITDDTLKSIEEDERETFVVDIPLKVTQANLRSSKKSSKLFFARYMSENTIWIEDKSTQHKYHNCIYEIGGESIDKLDISCGRTVQCCVDFKNGGYLALGLNGGKIKIIKLNENDHSDFSDYWEIVMHTTQDCMITDLCFSYDSKIMYSCATDSSIFAYTVKVIDDNEMPTCSLPVITDFPAGLDTEDISKMSLEECKQARRMNKVKMENKESVEKFKRAALQFLDRYVHLIEINSSLPKNLRIPKAYFRLETKEERDKEKQKLKIEDMKLLKPLKERMRTVFERVHTIQENFIDPIKTPLFYQFAIREPLYLKSLPERRLFSKDPFGDTEEDLNQKDTRSDWEKLLTNKTDTNQVKETEFERMVAKINLKLEKEQEREGFYKKGNTEKVETDAKPNELTSEEIPDLITAAGDFLCEYNKFTVTEKQAFLRINGNRLSRLKRLKEKEKLAKLETSWKHDTKKLEILYRNFKKNESKRKHQVPPLTEKLHDLLHIRQIIYAKKEYFNKKLKTLRKQKSELIDHFHWAQIEYRYMVEDMTRWRMHLDDMELPQPIEVVWDMEYPDVIKYEPGPKPHLYEERMACYENELEEIKTLIPIDELSDQVDIKSHPLFLIFARRKERFINNMILIKEQLNDMIENYDKQFLPLLLERSKTSLEVYELKSHYNSLLQEIDIIYRFDTLQKSVSLYKYEIIKVKHIHILRENIRKKKIHAFNEQVKECAKTIEDLNAKFAEMVKEEKWAKILTKTYKRKRKLPKTNEDSESESSSGSSSDDFDDFSFGDDDNGVGAAFLYDETIKPPGCDEDKFKHTFKLRYQRHVEENKIAEIRKNKDAILEEVKVIRTRIRLAEGLLALFYSGTYRFHRMMKDELDDVEYLVKLHPSQIQIFSKENSTNTIPPLERCKIIEQDDYLARMKSMQEMIEITQEVNSLVKKTNQKIKSKIKEHKELETQNAALEKEVAELLSEKYGGTVNPDDLQKHVLLRMIQTAIKRCTNELKDAEQRKINAKNKSEKIKTKEDLLKLKKERIKTLQTLYTIEAEKNRIAADKLVHRPRRSKTMDLAREKDSLLKLLKETDEIEKNLKASLKDA